MKDRGIALWRVSQKENNHGVVSDATTMVAVA